LKTTPKPTTFPTFPELNTLLDTLDHHLRDALPTHNHDKVAHGVCVRRGRAAGVAAGGSGTFGVSQAYAAYQRFGFTSSVLHHRRQHQRVRAQVRQHPQRHARAPGRGELGLVSGHNVVADGYNTEDYFHINFGWGGQSDGW
jgi:hypothetical protein